MLGAIIGDMVGSVYEFSSPKTKSFNIFNQLNRITDDSALTLAVARVLSKFYPLDYSKKQLTQIKKELVKEFIRTVRINPYLGYGSMFLSWARSIDKHEPYNSYGNGSAMRISPVGWIANSEEEVKLLSKAISEVTHNHKEAIKGAEAIAMCIFLARSGKSKEEIRDRVIKDYYPEIEYFNFEDLVKNYSFYPTCQQSVPQAIYCFLISKDLEDAIRNCVAIGGDTDTVAAMTASIAEAYYDTYELSEFEKSFLYLCVDPEIEKEIKDFYLLIGNRKFINDGK